MAETDKNTQPGGMDNSLKMRNTETAALKRMPVSANSTSASSAARKTIKLKPLVSSTGSAPGAQAAPPLSAKVAPPSILLNRKPAAQPAAEQAPKFMSTNTAPIVKMAKPHAEKPVQTADLNAEGGAEAKVSAAKASADVTKTVSIPRFQSRASAVRAAAPASAETVVAPAPALSTSTVATPKMTAAPAAASPAPASAASPAPAPKISAITGAVPKIARPGAAAGTVKPTYISTATSTVPKAASPASAAASPASTITQGIKKQAINEAKMQSGLQEAKPAIKLRPSASPENSPENLSATSPTIKLSPRTDSTVSPMPSNTEEKAPAAADVTVTTKLPRAKLQLKPKESAAPAPAPASGAAGAQPQQAKLREQGDIANKLTDQSAQEEAQTISQTGEEEQVQTNVVQQKVEKQPDEPNIIFAICAILAFLVIGYTVFALTAQYLNTWEHKKIPVVGFEQIDKSAKK